jgi:hypothetical protein
MPVMAWSFFVGEANKNSEQTHQMWLGLDLAPTFLPQRTNFFDKFLVSYLPYTNGY